MGNLLSQFFFIPTATLTEKTCPDQTGKVLIVTGGYAGVGFELCKILYAHNATVWIAGRSESKAQTAMKNIRDAAPGSQGQLEFLQLDLSNLATIKPAVENFIAKQPRLDVLINNAGVMYPPKGSLDSHGHDLMMGTNCLGACLLYQLLLPHLTKTAATSPTGSVRVLWAGSVAVHVASPKPHGLDVDDKGCPKDHGVMMNYGQSKVGNVFLSHEFAKTTSQTGIVHASFNPGNLRTELQRHWQGVGNFVTRNILCYDAIYGAYTELWAAIAPELTPNKTGAYVIPWGRFGSLPSGVENCMRAESDGGNGYSLKFLSWCDRETQAFA